LNPSSLLTLLGISLLVFPLSPLTSILVNHRIEPAAQFMYSLMGHALHVKLKSSQVLASLPLISIHKGECGGWD